VRNHFEDHDKPENVGHFIRAMKLDLFVSRDEYLDRRDGLARHPFTFRASA
jgi:hypothetical protein